MSFESDLEAAVRRHARTWVGKAAPKMALNANNNGITPRDTGQLADGLQDGPVRMSGSTIESDIRSTNTNKGFDYPDYLDKVFAVLPTRRKFLRWFGPGGQPIFSRGFSNVHKGWWKKVVTQAAWRQALEASRP